MAPKRTDDQVKVGELLAKARASLGLSVSFLGRMDGETQTFEVVESSIPFFRDGQSQPQKTSFCQAVLDGELPNVIPNVAKIPKAKSLPAARWPRIRSYVGVPVVLSDGSVYGTFCAVGFSADKELSNRDQALMEVLADATATIIEPGLIERQRNAEIRSRLDPLMDAGGPRVLVQPIVSLADGALIGAEALSRFPEWWAKAPDAVFAEAELVGAGTTLQLLAVRQASRHLDRVNGYVSVNLSPHALEDRRSLELLAGFPTERIVLELSEHEPVDDYDAMGNALAPLRANGVRLAIDDVGAGYSSLRHIMLTRPDIIKLDRSIIDGVAADSVQQTLVHSLVEFGHASGAGVVAEGIETLDDMRCLRDLGVDAGQGWYFGRADEPDLLRPRYRPFAGAEPVASTGDVSDVVVRSPRTATKASTQHR
jgi:EAL domain-containing protein (putative c-di-GMP-specific phosphodiesterase class I)